MSYPTRKQFAASNTGSCSLIAFCDGSTVLYIESSNFGLGAEIQFAREFEATQIASYILGGAKEKANPLLAKLLTLPYTDLNMAYVEAFLRGHSKHYDADKKYGSIENEINALVVLIYKQYESY